MNVVIQDELVFEVPGPWWRSTWLCNLGVATLVILEFFFALEDGLVVGPALAAESVAAKAIFPMLIVLAVEGLRVERDD